MSWWRVTVLVRTAWADGYMPVSWAIPARDEDEAKIMAEESVRLTLGWGGHNWTVKPWQGKAEEVTT